MKTWSILVAVLVLALSTSLVMAQNAGKNKNMVRGTITKIDGANVTIQPVTPKDTTTAPDPKTFATDDKTVVTAGTKDGDKKAVSDLAKDQKVFVVLSEDGKTAVSIVINPTRPAGGGKAGN